MAKGKTRRKRYNLITSVIGAVFLSALIITFWFISSSEQVYTPGQDIEGLTSELARSIPEDYPRVTFTDVTNEAGIDFQHFYGTRSTQLPEDMGSGAAWGDYNNDGWIDLYIANQSGPLTMSERELKNSPATSVLYHNNGDGTFTDVSATAGVDLKAMAIAPAWGDYDNDGYPDLFVACYGKNKLYHNNRDGTFTDVSDNTGFGKEEGFWAGASWGDFNKDGFLDLYVCGYVKYHVVKSMDTELQYDVEVPASLNPSSFEPERNLLLRNNGDGSFSEISAEAGVENINGRSLSAAWCDLDEDGWPDLYVANDVSDNVLYRNLGNSTFEEISHSALVADYRGAMGIGIGDWNGDEDLDMFVTHWIAQENALYSNLKAQLQPAEAASPTPLRFMDEADRYGLGQIALDYIGFGTSFFDYNNDGKPDLYVVNGSTFQQNEDPTLLEPMQDQLFWNRNADEGFYDVSAVSGEYFTDMYVGRGSAYADYDNDGDLDLFVVNNNGPGILLRNNGGNTHNWLKLDLRGVQSNASAIGARIRLVADGSVQIRQVGAQSSYCSQNSLIEHFGVGQGKKVDTLEIIWPSGNTQSFTSLPSNKTIRITEGETPDDLSSPEL